MTCCNGVGYDVLLRLESREREYPDRILAFDAQPVASLLLLLSEGSVLYCTKSIVLLGWSGQAKGPESFIFAVAVRSMEHTLGWSGAQIDDSV